MSTNVVVVTGAGGMGQAVARRLGPGAHLVLADFNEESLVGVADQLRGEGYEVTPVVTDVSSRAAVTDLAQKAASLGEVRSVVHTAGLSPVQAPVAAILAVDLLGVALVVEQFGEVVAAGGAGVVVASMAGHVYPTLTREQSLELARTPADQLLSLPIADPGNFPAGTAAYAFAKHANLLRVQAASTTWGRRGARINTISPGAIATPMGQAELGSDHNKGMQATIDGSNAGRMGTAAEIAAATEFLLGPSAAFISGTDLLVDGGAFAAIRSGHLDLGWSS
ncbi:NAD(P)-dependent dehydrogenase (short-subunit alcohol dehydrogenase family) [Promicromonospora sp. AC04]|uniref:SDR family oxidoreductase n=1 Tax=Promicromonospora sp. AC04 TaxID=2135723 RepID=UPI000D35A2D5|nr:SDR family oxidoreductase [Promicromonospora sp. AC04]PUB25369.1 NAD(P)-dependent dehydrogenase (short-subunit alcohol dehydrogenase family) [Promicromonospora sp. AC04]